MLFSKWAFSIPIRECEEILLGNKVEVKGSELQIRESLKEVLSRTTGDSRGSYLEFAKFELVPIPSSTMRITNESNRTRRQHGRRSCNDISGFESDSSQSDRSIRNNSQNSSKWVVETVRKWGIKFSGSKKPQEAIIFLNKLEDLAECCEVDLDMLPRAMPVILTGDADEWYCTNQKDWVSWTEFKREFNRFFVPAEFSDEIEDEIIAYQQGPDQPIKQYVLRMRSLYRFASTKSETEKLNRIYKNSRCEFKNYIRRSEVKTVEQFMKECEVFEKTNELTSGGTNQNTRGNKSLSGTRFGHERTAAMTDENTMNNGDTHRNPFRNPPISNNTGNSQRFERRNEDYWKNITCFNCDRTGHTARRCKEPVRPWCRNCKRRGVHTDQCDCQREPPTLELCPLCRRRVPNAANCNCTIPGPSRGNNNTVNGASQELNYLHHDSRPYRPVEICNETFYALMDTGSTATYINNKVGQLLLDRGSRQQPSMVSTTLADGTNRILSKFIVANVRLGDKVVSHRLIVLPTLEQEVLLGIDILTKFKIDLVETDRYFRGESCSAIRSRELLNEDQEKKLSNLLEEELPKFEKLCSVTNFAEHVIRMKTDEPIRQRYYPKNPKMREVIYAQIDELVNNKQIEPSTSAYCSPIVLVKKKNNTWRMCIDFRRINEHSIRDAYPMPQINSILSRLQEAQYVSAIDLKNGYWQVPINVESRQYTAFVVPGRGLYQWRVMPFGLHSAPATFQRLLDQVVTCECDAFSVAYLDDIIIFSKDFESHLEHIRVVLRRLQEANLRINTEKSIFCKEEIQYLGHVVGGNGIKTDPGKIRAIVELEPPTNVSGVRRILGMVTWYAKFIKGFTKMVAPIQELLHKDCKFEWTETRQRALEEIKERMTTAPIIACPNYTLPFYLQTDASDVGIGSVLFQRDGENELVIAYRSRSLRPAEKNYTTTEKDYTTTEKECLAVVWSIEKNLEYLEGITFVVITDHMALKWIFKLPNPTGRLGRWVMEMRNYDFTLEHRKGIDNVVADTLSRHPIKLMEDSSEEFEEQINTHCAAIEGDEGCSWIQGLKQKIFEYPEKYPEYHIERDQVFRNCGGRLDGTHWKLCVPETQRTRVLKECHSDVLAGHFGINKTINKVLERYTWPRLARDVTKFVRECPSCLENKVPQTKPAGKMYTTQTKEPWEVVTIDFVGPLPRTSKGFCHILVIQDKFSKWVEVTPVAKATATGLKKILREKIFCRFGWPRVVITDNGSQFSSRAFKRFLVENGVKQQFTPPYSPQCNSTERINRVIKTCIKQFLGSQHTGWSDSLSEIQFAINSAVQDSTGFSPATINFGRNPRTPHTLYEEAGGEHQRYDPESHQEHMKQLRELVTANMAKASVMQSKYYNLRRREWSPQIGDQVYKRNYPLSKAATGYAAKLVPYYSGPFYVQNFRSPNVVELTKEGDAPNKIYRAHIKDLKEVRADDRAMSA